MTIFRNKLNGKSYIIEHLIKDLRFLNNNQFAGYYAYPLDKSDILFSKDNEFLSNFIPVSIR